MTETPQKIDDGGPAMPTPTYAESRHKGMSVRMWLAGRSQIPWDGLIDALTRKFPDRDRNFTFDEVLEYRAQLRFVDADALIAAPPTATPHQYPPSPTQP